VAKDSSPSSSDSLAERILQLLAREHDVRNLLLVEQTEAEHSQTGQRIWRIVAVAVDDANGTRYSVVVDDNGNPLEVTPELESLFGPTHDARKPIPAPRATTTSRSSVTIAPADNALTLNLGETLHETLKVTVPAKLAAPKVDVYFLADTTGSMASILHAVQTGANNILTALSGLGIDLAYGVGNYKDFPSDPYAFRHQLSPTMAVANVMAEINAWSASGGFDAPEGQLFALDSLAVPPGGSIGWRLDSKRIVVWFGDVPGHDPICTGISGAAVDTTEATVTAKLVRENIIIVAISTATPGLDGDPKTGASDYHAVCGHPGGTPGQATRLATATGGAFATGINPATIVSTIVSLVSSAVASINSVKLVPTTEIASFVASIVPPAGYGPLAGDRDHKLTFHVKFAGKTPCNEEEQVLRGTIDVVVDGVVVVAKRVRITVPPCQPKEFVYSVKFVCGTQPECPCECTPVAPGYYATEVSVHNGSGQEVAIHKRVVPVVLAGAPVGREPASSGPRAEDSLRLPPHSASFDDCCRLSELLGASGSTLQIGFLEIAASAEVAVTAAYYSSGLSTGGVSIDVQQITSHRR